MTTAFATGSLQLAPDLGLSALAVGYFVLLAVVVGAMAYVWRRVK